MTATSRQCSRIAATGAAIAVALLAWTPPAVPGADRLPERTPGDEARLQAVRAFADRALERGRDRWSGRDTPLLADGLNVETGEPVVWRFDGEEYIISNLASQQNLFRALVGLSNLTGEPRYRQAAEDAVRYHFEHLAAECGLLRWGGHQFVDLRTLEPVGHFDADCHELKCNYPFYELLWEVCPEATARYIRAFWNAHVRDWGLLDMNRHGSYGGELGPLWEHVFHDPEPFYEGDGLSFINCGSDLIYAGGMLYRLAGEEGALTWSQRLASMYVRARHPETGLGVYQFSKPRRRQDPPDGPLTGRYTWSTYGDRAENQFGAEFGDVAREGWALWGQARTIYARDGFVQLGMAEAMGEAGADFLQWTADGLEAYARHAYVPEENHFRPMWADGTDLTGYRIQRTGYYGEQGRELRPLRADADFLLVYARAFRLAERDALWETARRIAAGLGLGEIGRRPGEAVALELDAPGDSPEEVFAMLELYRAAPDPAYLERARRVADRIIERRLHDGFFFPGPGYLNANFDRIEPLAILALEATLRGAPEQVPAHVGGRGYIHGRFDGLDRTYDHRAIWSVRRSEAGD